MKNPAKHSPEPFSSGSPVELPLNERRVLRRDRTIGQTR